MPVPELFKHTRCRTHGQKQAHQSTARDHSTSTGWSTQLSLPNAVFSPLIWKSAPGDSLGYKWLPHGHLNPQENQASCYFGATFFDSKNNPARTPCSERCMCQGLVGSDLKLYVKWLWCVFIWIIYINYIIDTYVPHPTCSLVTKTECLHYESCNQTISLRQNSL